MNAKESIARSLQQLLKSNTMTDENTTFVIGKVMAGSVSGNYCDVQPLDGVLIKKVRLNAAAEKKGLLMIPADDSFVIVAMLSNVDALVVLYSKIKKLQYSDEGDFQCEIEGDKVSVKNTSGMECVIDGEKVNIRNNSYSLAEAFKDMLSAIGKLTVTTAVGPSGTPINIPEFNTIQQKLNQLLK